MKLLIMIYSLCTITAQAAEKPKEKELTPHEQFCSRQFKRDQDMIELENLGTGEKAARFIKALGDLDKCLHEKKGSADGKGL